MALQDFEGKIESVEDMTTDVRLFKIRLDKPIEFFAGQYMTIIFEDEGQKYIRPYSIASSPTCGDLVEFCIKLVKQGQATPHLWHKKQGDSIKLKGPSGGFVLKETEKKEIVMIGAGTGIAPLRSMIGSLIEKETDKKMTLISGVRFEQNILFEEEMKKLENENENFRFIPVISKPSENWKGKAGHVQDHLSEINAKESVFYLCGLPAMVEGTCEKLIELGVSEEDIVREKY